MVKRKREAVSGQDERQSRPQRVAWVLAYVEAQHERSRDRTLALQRRGQYGVRRNRHARRTPSAAMPLPCRTRITLNPDVPGGSRNALSKKSCSSRQIPVVSGGAGRAAEALPPLRSQVRPLDAALDFGEPSGGNFT
jgi:hypothetical protein